jgi:hypothetical protein
MELMNTAFLLLGVSLVWIAYEEWNAKRDD